MARVVHGRGTTEVWGGTAETARLRGTGAVVHHGRSDRRCVPCGSLRPSGLPPCSVPALPPGGGGSSRVGEIHQATGMVLAQLGISAENALARLRAHAFAEQRPLVDVARAVVS